MPLPMGPWLMYVPLVLLSVTTTTAAPLSSLPSRSSKVQWHALTPTQKREERQDRTTDTKE